MNKIYLIGNLSTDVEKGATASGVAFCRFSLAVSRRSSKDSETDFFPIVCWRSLADICANNLKKGKKVCVVGSVQLRKYQAQDGSNRTAIDVVAEDVEFLTPRDQNAGQTEGSAPQLQESTSSGSLPF